VRLDSVKVALPARPVSNDEILEMVRLESASTYHGDLDRLVALIRALLRRSGAEQRFWRAPGDTVMNLIAKAVDEAISSAGCRKTDVDLLICSGVDRGFVEPATAYLIAQALDLGTPACFDVVDACNGWSRSLQIVDSLFRGGIYRRALIVNPEFPMFEGGPIYPRLFALRDRTQLVWSLAGYTLGEGVAATVVSSDSNRDWEFHFASRPDLADLSTLPLTGYQRFCQAGERIAINGVGHFAAFSDQMFRHATAELHQLFQHLESPVGDVRVIFPHGATKRSWDLEAEKLGVRDRLFHTFPRVGNLASASIPASLAHAIDSGALRRGDRALTCVASAGMSFSVCSFVY
jgi:3-oxoacyl-[acyl-carrier-protein] synthase III